MSRGFESFDLFLRRARQCRCRSTPAPRDVIAPLDLGLTAPNPSKPNHLLLLCPHPCPEAQKPAGAPEAGSRR
jgi:hypothetical protein